MRALRIAATAAVLVLGASPAPSVAAGIAVPGGEDGTVSVTGERGDDGGLTATVAVTNTGAGDEEVTVEAADDGCAAQVAPNTAFEGRVTTVTITLTCDEPATSDREVALVVGGLDVEVTITVDEPQQWWWLLLVVLASAGTAAVVVASAVLWRISGRREQVPARADGSHWGVRDPDTRSRPAVTEPVGFRSLLTNAPTEWSFSDSWASTFAAGVALLTALFGSTDVLGALLGDAPEGAEARLLVLAGVAGLAVGLAPLFLAFFGTDTSTNVLGLTVAAVLTVTGTLVQLVGIPTVLWSSDVRDPAVGLAAFLTLALLAYAVRTLSRVLAKTFPRPVPGLPDPEPSETMVIGVAQLIGPVPQSNPAAVFARLDAAREAARAYLLADPEHAVDSTASGPGGSYPRVPWDRTSSGDDRTRTVLL